MPTESTQLVIDQLSKQAPAGSLFWTDVSLNEAGSVAANQTTNGAARINEGAAGVASTRYRVFCAEAFCDQAGTLAIDKSIDGGTTWRQVASIAVVANQSSELSTRIKAKHYRARFVSGGTQGGVLTLCSAYVGS